MESNINFILNFQPVEIKLNPMKRLIDVLRDDFSLTGVKEGCGQGECGACSVMVDGMLTNSCIYPVGMVYGRKVVTIEGLSNTPQFRVLKESFEEAGAVQCGFCTPGMIMAAFCLLKKNPHPTDGEIREGISGNLCRCTGYNMIINAVRDASIRGDGLW
jgi:Aerobic-type carbon monoxide dehydrogenase, small subunit CoxS/CutS homologs